MSVMDEYIKIVQDAITKYLKLVFERKFNKQICDSYIKTYIDVRYYNCLLYTSPSPRDTR